MPELCLRKLAEIIGGRLRLGAMPPLGGDLDPVGRIVADCRQVQPGDVFWALPGAGGDGSRFVEEAFVRGAQGVVLSGRRVEPWAGKFAVEVDDCGWALWQLARWARTRFSGHVVAVAGRLGKTTTRMMIDAVLRSRLTGSSGPRDPEGAGALLLALADLRQADDYAILEFPTRASSQNEALAALCGPHVAVVTNDWPAPDGHDSDGHTAPRLAETASSAAIAAGGCKTGRGGELAALLAALPPEGTLVFNGDDDSLARSLASAAVRRVSVGRGSHCDLAAAGIRSREGKLSFTIEGQPIRMNVWGRHLVPAALAAFAVGRSMGIPPRAIAESLAGFRSPPARCEVSEAHGLTIIDDTFSADVASTRAALELLRDAESSGRRVVVCGRIADGPIGNRACRRLGELCVRTCGADVLVALGPQAREVANGAGEAGMPSCRTIVCSTRDEAAIALRSTVVPGDVVLFEGGPQDEMRTLIESLRRADRVAA
jgi:UDP-N-acetylmuramoyl-tripeptide--D-alanyl-D-alanine ligase